MAIYHRPPRRALASLCSDHTSVFRSTGELNTCPGSLPSASIDAAALLPPTFLCFLRAWLPQGWVQHVIPKSWTVPRFSLGIFYSECEQAFQGPWLQILLQAILSIHGEDSIYILARIYLLPNPYSRHFLCHLKPYMFRTEKNFSPQSKCSRQD